MKNELGYRADVLMIGAAKCATTSIARLLDQHPGIGLSHPKEPHFFSHDTSWAKGWSWYSDVWRKCDSDAQLLVDASTTYSNTVAKPQILTRIQEHMSHAKIIFAVRDPLPRVSSFFRELFSRNHISMPIDDAVRQYENTFVSSSLYWQTYRDYCRVFGEERIHVIFFEDFKKDPKRIIHDTIRFLGLAPSDLVGDVERHDNRGSTKRRNYRWVDALQSKSRRLHKLLVRHPKKYLPVTERLYVDSSPIPADLSDESKAFILERISVDAKKMLLEFGKPTDFWNLDLP